VGSECRAVRLERPLTRALTHFSQNDEQAWASGDGSNPPRSVRAGVTFEDPCMYIYTSGTTGLPKAAVIKHAKFFGAGAAFSINFGITHEDRIYNSGLPLYHSAGNNIGGGVVLYTGATLVLRRKFSATNYWKDAGKCAAASTREGGLQRS